MAISPCYSQGSSGSKAKRIPVARVIPDSQAKADSSVQRRIELDILAAQARDTSEIRALPGLTPEERRKVEDVFGQVHPEIAVPASEGRTP